MKTKAVMARGYVWVWIAALALCVACAGKKRPFGDGVAGSGVEVGESMDEGAGGSGTPGSGESQPNPMLVTSDPSNTLVPGSLGAPCVTGAECNAPGFCVDGVCCSSACTELCAACDVPGSLGTCSAAPIDEACGALTCAGVDTECRKLDTTQLALNCEAFGACKLQADCAVVNEPSSTPCQAAAGACSGTGACLVAGKASLGDTCTADADCAEGHCIAGEGGALICCDAACDRPCQACSAEGHCEETPSTDDRCEAVACPPDDVCRDYTTDVTASQCRAFGQCQTGLDCPRTALRPDAECECDPVTAACRLRPGATCTAAEDCASGVCSANAEGTSICCASACAEGLFCSSDGSACVACEGNAISCDGSTERRCNGGVIATAECRNGCTPGTGCNDLPPLGFLCDGGECAAPNVCQLDVTGASRCCSRNCAAEGKVCAENGSCICEEGQVASGADCLLQNGDPCTTSAQCQAGATCTDGVCCQQACNGSCERCEPNTGLCVAIGAGQTDNTCSNGRQCTGTRGDCRLTVRQPCNGNGAECTTNNCEPTVGNATLICCSQSCSGNRPFCRSNGQGCVQCETNAECGNGCDVQTGLCNDLLLIGMQCGTTSQCVGGAQCLLDQNGQTRCCERNCAAEGLVCNGQGRCAPPCSGDQEFCDGLCANLNTDANNCGSCGHDCLDGRCQAGACQPFALATGLSLAQGLAVNGTHVYWVEGVNQADYAMRRIDKTGLDDTIQNILVGRQPLSSLVLNNSQAFTMEGRSGNVSTERVIIRVPLEGGTARDFTTDFAAGAAVGASGNSIYWLGFDNNGAQFGRSAAVTGAAFPPNPTLFALVSANALSGWSFANNCLIYMPAPNGPELHRRCETDNGSVRIYETSDGAAPLFDRFSTDAQFAYFFEGQGTSFSLKRIRLDGSNNGVATNVVAPVSDRVMPPTADSEGIYFFRNSNDIFGCGEGWTMSRAGKAPGSSAATRVSAAQTCPTQLISDGSTLYWAVTDAGIGSIMALVK